jgi:hypothetical protein
MSDEDTKTFSFWVSPSTSRPHSTSGSVSATATTAASFSVSGSDSKSGLSVTPSRTSSFAVPLPNVTAEDPIVSWLALLDGSQGVTVHVQGGYFQDEATLLATPAPTIDPRFSHLTTPAPAIPIGDAFMPCASGCVVVAANELAIAARITVAIEGCGLNRTAMRLRLTQQAPLPLAEQYMVEIRRGDALVLAPSFECFVHRPTSQNPNAMAFPLYVFEDRIISVMNTRDSALIATAAVGAAAASPGAAATVVMVQSLTRATYCSGEGPAVQWFQYPLPVGPSRYDDEVYLMVILFGFAVTAAVAALQLAVVEICHCCHWCMARGAAMSREGWRATLRFPSLLVIPTFLMLPGIATATTVILSRWVDRPHVEQIVAVVSASVVLILVPTLLTFRFALRFGAVMRIRPWAMRTHEKTKEIVLGGCIDLLRDGRCWDAVKVCFGGQGAWRTRRPPADRRARADSENRSRADSDMRPRSNSDNRTRTDSTISKAPVVAPKVSFTAAYGGWFASYRPGAHAWATVELYFVAAVCAVAALPSWSPHFCVIRCGVLVALFGAHVVVLLVVWPHRARFLTLTTVASCALCIAALATALRGLLLHESAQSGRRQETDHAVSQLFLAATYVAVVGNALAAVVELKLRFTHWRSRVRAALEELRVPQPTHEQITFDFDLHELEHVARLDADAAVVMHAIGPLATERSSSEASSPSNAAVDGDEEHRTDDAGPPTAASFLQDLRAAHEHWANGGREKLRCIGLQQVHAYESPRHVAVAIPRRREPHDWKSNHEDDAPPQIVTHDAASSGEHLPVAARETTMVDDEAMPDALSVIMQHLGSFAAPAASDVPPRAAPPMQLMEVGDSNGEEETGASYHDATEPTASTIVERQLLVPDGVPILAEAPTGIERPSLPALLTAPDRPSLAPSPPTVPTLISNPLACQAATQSRHDTGTVAPRLVSAGAELSTFADLLSTLHGAAPAAAAETCIPPPRSRYRVRVVESSSDDSDVSL